MVFGIVDYGSVFLIPIFSKFYAVFWKFTGNPVESMVRRTPGLVLFDLDKGSGLNVRCRGEEIL